MLSLSTTTIGDSLNRNRQSVFQMMSALATTMPSFAFGGRGASSRSVPPPGARADLIDGRRGALPLSARARPAAATVRVGSAGGR